MINRYITILALAASLTAAAEAPRFDDIFEDRTLRLDYIFAGDSDHSAIYFEEAGQYDGWAGRRHNLDKPFLTGNGQITLRDHETGQPCYSNSFSTLFQEWQCGEEAKVVARAYESTFLVPMPKKAMDVTVDLLNNRHETVASLTHTVNPGDILIRHIPATKGAKRYLQQSGTPGECVDIVIMGEGYTKADAGKFFADAERAAEAMMSHEPFASMKDKFNILALFPESADEGPSVPREGKWHDTPARTHFDTFYYDRYLTTQAIHDIYDVLGDTPVEHIVLIVNTPMYGGGGIFNQITIATSDHPTFKAVLVHEFGHAYGGLGDEYYSSEFNETYPLDVEPWEPNITTMVDFDSKWRGMIGKNTPVPTPAEGIDVKKLDKTNSADRATMERLNQTVGAYEGGGYRAKGVYRPVQECRMKVNEVEEFCPVCSKAIVDITDWYTNAPK